ncbi:MAG: alanine racemase [Nitrospinales bacterium]
MAYHRATLAEIDLSALRRNLSALRSALGVGVDIMAVVKADAYGHGAVPCARAALEAGATSLGVGVIEEGIELRESGIRAPVLVMSGVAANEIDDLLHHDLATTVYTQSLVQALSKRAAQAGKHPRIHIKVDTGMTRLGISTNDLLCLAENARDCGNLEIEGVCTHFSSADEEDDAYTLQQLSRFEAALGELQAAGIRAPQIHCANSAAILKYPQSRFNLVRPGLILYGALPSPALQPYLEPVFGGEPPASVMRLKSKIILIKQTARGTPLSYGRKYVTQRDSLIATLPIGYADGLTRTLSGKMQVIVRGKKAPQVGAVCMDMILIDVTDIPGVEVDDEVIIFGGQGEQRIRVEETAAWGGTIPYEILCAVGKRVPRIYDV